jgi:hypothetical protein
MPIKKGNIKSSNPSACQNFEERMVRTRKARKFYSRLHAEEYLLLTLISFALTVSVTRLLLYLTGYPQLGNNELHIAHVLWGGLLLFIACLLMLLYANRLIRIWGAILAGVGVGLFIDEVGKFITQSNNYFFPPAAPIIYAIFLLTMMVYFLSRRRKRLDPRSELYAVTQQLEEMLDHELTGKEKEEMFARLQYIRANAGERELQELADSLTHFLQKKELHITDERLDIVEKTDRALRQIESRYFGETLTRGLITASLILLSAWLLVKPLMAILYSGDLGRTQVLFAELIKNNLLASQESQAGYLAVLVAQSTLAIVFLAAAILLLAKVRRTAVLLAYVGLLVTLTALNLLVFYYDQFSTIFSALYEFILLFCLLRFRQRFLKA